MRQLRERLKQRWSGLYRVASASYWQIRDLGTRVLGTTVQEAAWASRGLEEIRKGLGAEHHPHRAFLLTQLSAFEPVSSVLEIGSGFGPNLYHIATKYPQATVTGIDINPISVQVGTEWFARQGLSHVTLVTGRADDLKDFSDHSYDVVQTDALLMYIGPDKILRVVGEVLRVAHKGALFVEQHWDRASDNAEGLGTYQGGRWVRDYVALLRRFVLPDRISLVKIPPELWPDRQWQELGYVVRVHLEP